MSNFFSDALNDLSSLEEEILGPDYPYYKYVKSPSDMGMSASGSKIATNIGGLIAYTEVLVTGTGISYLLISASKMKLKVKHSDPRHHHQKNK